ncbi:MAG: head GIN domain-containing protein [Burkholderiales bacterium]
MPYACIPLQAIGAPLKRAAFVIALCAAALASPAANAWNWSHGFGSPVAGSGRIKTETRAVSGFTGVALSVGASVEILQGNAERVVIQADDNILPLVETVVENGTLKIRAARGEGSFAASKLNLTVYAKSIDALSIAGGGAIHAAALRSPALKASIAGAGDIGIDALEAGELDVDIAGSGDFSAAGHAARLHASIAGMGDVKAANLDARAVEVSIAGSGDAIVWARDTLRVSVVGAGEVKYYGDARVHRSIVGAGEIKRLGAAPAAS